MKHILLLLLSLLLSVSLSAQDIKTFVSHQTAEYPELHLLDLYKSCFQDYMGAEHLVSDRERVKAYLDEELNTTDMNDLPEWYYEPCGIKGRYVRVSPRAVKEGLIREDLLLDAFIRSANTKRPSVKSWSRRWHRIIGTIDKMRSAHRDHLLAKHLNLPGYDREKQFIDSLLSVGKYAVSHSTDYREAYHPHYRIVERHIFEKELKPLIDKGETHNKVEIVYDYNFINGMALKKPEDKTIEETMQYFKAVKGVTHVEYDHIYRLTDPVTPKIEIK